MHKGQSVRLARSAEHRHRNANFNGGTGDNRDASGALVAHGADRYIMFSFLVGLYLSPLISKFIVDTLFIPLYLSCLLFKSQTDSSLFVSLINLAFCV